jgi:MFS family permease
MSLYTSFLSVGVAFGIIISGLITMNHHWIVIYQVAAALIGFVLLLAFFTFPETAYIRDTGSAEDFLGHHIYSGEKPDITAGSNIDQARRVAFKKHSYWRSLKISHRTLTKETLLTLVVRPLGLICLPPVLWSALVQSVTIGFLVAVTSNVDLAFVTTYGFQSYQAGLCFFAGILGSIAGIPVGGLLGDKVADWLTQRNGGVRDPEMRLPAMIPSLITTPLALVLYGVGIQHKLHWICPTIGLGLCKFQGSKYVTSQTHKVTLLTPIASVNFSIVSGNNVALVYVIDAYRPVAGEITLAVMGFKSCFGFLLSFYTNPWVEKSGYQDAYGTMAAISAACILLTGPMFLWGKKIRHATWSWPVIASVHWHDDREVGE